jgi:hypothetical protein
MGPNVHLLLRKLRTVFDPAGICSPGRQVYTAEELEVFLEKKGEGINRLREQFNLKPITKD